MIDALPKKVPGTLLLYCSRGCGRLTLTPWYDGANDCRAGARRSQTVADAASEIVIALGNILDAKIVEKRGEL